MGQCPLKKKGGWKRGVREGTINGDLWEKKKIFLCECSMRTREGIIWKKKKDFLKKKKY